MFKLFTIIAVVTLHIRNKLLNISEYRLPCPFLLAYNHEYDVLGY